MKNAGFAKLRLCRSLTVLAYSNYQRVKTASDPATRKLANNGLRAITENIAVSWGLVPRVARIDGVRLTYAQVSSVLCYLSLGANVPENNLNSLTNCFENRIERY